MSYTFNTILLSAKKTGNPVLTSTSLSSNGVNTLSLSTNDKGIVFNTVTPLLSSTTSCNILGSVFTVDKAYHGSTLALVKVPSNNVASYTIFTHNSALSTVPTSAIVSTTETDVSDPEVRRKWLLGYM